MKNIYILAILTMVIVVWGGLWFITEDANGALALFSGLAFVGLIYTLLKTEQQLQIAKKSSEAPILLSLLNDYASVEMLDALRILRHWKEVNGDNFAKKFAKERASHSEVGNMIDRARRYVLWYYTRAMILNEMGILSDSNAKKLISWYRASIVWEIIEPMEWAMTESSERGDYNSQIKVLEFISRLHGRSLENVPEKENVYGEIRCKLKPLKS